MRQSRISKSNYNAVAANFILKTFATWVAEPLASDKCMVLYFWAFFCFMYTAWSRLYLDLNLTSTLIHLVLFCPVLSNAINSMGLLSLSLHLQRVGNAQQTGFWKVTYCISPLTLASYKAETQYKFSGFCVMYLSRKNVKITIVFILQFPYFLCFTDWHKLKEWLFREVTL